MSTTPLFFRDLVCGVSHIGIDVGGCELCWLVDRHRMGPIITDRHHLLSVRFSSVSRLHRKA